MKAYLSLVEHVLAHGESRSDRTGVGTFGIFDARISHPMFTGFPILTTKRVHFKSVVAEILWMISGAPKADMLREMGCTIWDEWLPEGTDKVSAYGPNWRSWGGDYDQFSRFIDRLNTDPYSRRHILSTWDPKQAEDPRIALPPCHYALQAYIHKDRTLDFKVHMRSTDVFLGLPFNLAGYALLLEMVALHADTTPGMLTIDMGDCHIYKNHFPMVGKQLERDLTLLPKLEIHKQQTIFDYKPEHFRLIGYNPHPTIKAPVAV